MRQHLTIKELQIRAPRLAAALHQVGHRKADIQITAPDSAESTTRSLFSGGAVGKTAFAYVIHSLTTETGADDLFRGSMGGPNPFIRDSNPVNDPNGAPVEIPAGGAIITGYLGDWMTVHVTQATFLRLTVDADTALVATDALLEGRTDAAAELVAAAKGTTDSLTDEERWTLYTFISHKSAYRKEYLSRIERGSKGKAGTKAMIAALVERGYLNANKAGAISVTTKGKNAGAKEAPYEVQRGY